MHVAERIREEAPTERTGRSSSARRMRQPSGSRMVVASVRPNPRARPWVWHTPRRAESLHTKVNQSAPRAAWAVLLSALLQPHTFRSGVAAASTALEQRRCYSTPTKPCNAGIFDPQDVWARAAAGVDRPGVAVRTAQCGAARRDCHAGGHRPVPHAPQLHGHLRACGEWAAAVGVRAGRLRVPLQPHGRLQP